MGDRDLRVRGSFLSRVSKPFPLLSLFLHSLRFFRMRLELISFRSFSFHASRLSPAIEHLRDLLTQRLGLLSRLNQLRSQAKASYPREEHPRLGLEGGGAWEMEWEGGKEEEGSDEDGEE